MSATKRYGPLVALANVEDTTEDILFDDVQHTGPTQAIALYRGPEEQECMNIGHHRPPA